MLYEQYTIGGEFMHSAKGVEWKNKKYIDKIKTKTGKWRYIYDTLKTRNKRHDIKGKALNFQKAKENVRNELIKGEHKYSKENPEDPFVGSKEQKEYLKDLSTERGLARNAKERLQDEYNKSSLMEVIDIIKKKKKKK